MMASSSLYHRLLQIVLGLMGFYNRRDSSGEKTLLTLKNYSYSIVQIFIHSDALSKMLSIGGAILFSLFIVFDTSMIMHKVYLVIIKTETISVASWQLVFSNRFRQKSTYLRPWIYIWTSSICFCICCRFWEGLVTINWWIDWRRLFIYSTTYSRLHCLLLWLA